MQCGEIDMTRAEFISLIGHDVVVDYRFGKEVQSWSMKNFTYDPATDTVKHNRLPLIMDIFIPKAHNPHIGKATHG